MRVISGRFRGRDLGRVPDGVRPTSDRVRESLFGSLGELEGLRVLDLFSGTGALGIEALSRGATGAVFVERSKRVARLLAERLTSFGLDADPEVELICCAATTALRRLSAREDGRSFDLVFLDPPYGAGEREPILERLADSPILAAGAIVVVEGPKRHPLPPVAGWRVTRERRYGDTLLTWLEGRSPSEAPRS